MAEKYIYDYTTISGQGSFKFKLGIRVTSFELLKVFVNGSLQDDSVYTIEEDSNQLSYVQFIEPLDSGNILQFRIYDR